MACENVIHERKDTRWHEKRNFGTAFIIENSTAELMRVGTPLKIFMKLPHSRMRDGVKEDMSKKRPCLSTAIWRSRLRQLI